MTVIQSCNFKKYPISLEFLCYHLASSKFQDILKTIASSSLMCFDWQQTLYFKSLLRWRCMEMAVTEPSGIQYRKQIINKLTYYVIIIKSMGFYVSVAIHSDMAILVEELKYLNSSVRSLITFSSSFHHLCFDESVLHSEFEQSHLKQGLWRGSTTFMAGMLFLGLQMASKWKMNGKTLTLKFVFIGQIF